MRGGFFGLLEIHVCIYIYIHYILYIIYVGFFAGGFEGFVEGCLMMFEGKMMEKLGACCQ